MNSKRVVITGIGIVSPIGIGIDEFWQSAVQGKNGIRRIGIFDPSGYPSQIAGEIDEQQLQQYPIWHRHPSMDRSCRFVWLAAVLARQDAGIEVTDDNRRMLDIIVGSAIVNAQTLICNLDLYREKGITAISPSLLSQLSPSRFPAIINKHFQLQGECLTVDSGCSSSLSAIQIAYLRIKYGESLGAFAGGCDSGIEPYLFSILGHSNLISRRNDKPEEASRPFDQKRDGYVVSEGAAILFLEEYEHARSRNANIYAEIKGTASLNDPNCTLQKDRLNPTIGIECLKRALQQAQINSIDYYCAHGSSSFLMDIKETKIIKGTFKNQSKNIPISSIKSMIGHPMGAAGAMQLAVCAKTIQNNQLIPTRNYCYPDPECDLDYVPNQCRDHVVDQAATYNSGMGGANVCIVVTRV